MNYTLQGSDIIVGDICIITDDVHQSHDLLKLSKTVGPDMHYQSEGMALIDYPGEYELNGLTIECISDSEGSLNYTISQGDLHIGYVQNPKLVTNRIFADVTDWICNRDDIIVAIEKLDETGKIHNLRDTQFDLLNDYII